jgi:hypothetical protein
MTDLKNTVWTITKDLSEVEPEAQHRLKLNHSILMSDGRKYTNHKDFYIRAYSSYGGYPKGDFYSFADYDSGDTTNVKLVKGCCIAITGGEASTDPYLINWFYENAVEVSMKLECSIDYDDEWIQEDCHWKYDRIFTFTCKLYLGDLTDITTGSVLPGSSYTSRAFNISFEENHADYKFITVQPKVKTYQVPFNENYTRKLEVLTYTARASTLVNYMNRDSAGDLTVTLKIGTLSTEGIRQDSIIQEIIPYQVPPKQITKVTPSLVVSNPGELKITWTKPDVYNDDSDSVHGYCVEVDSCPAEGVTGTFSPVKGLKWDEEQLEVGKYVLVKDPNYTKLTFDSTVYSQEEITNGEFTFGSDTTTREFYIANPDTTEFYFKPKDIGINSGDLYQITVYPYCVYSQYYEEGETVPQPSAFLAGTATIGTNKISKGVVRVKTTGGWVEGQVWVMTDKGWKQAEAVYTKTADGWKEAQ